MGAVAYLRGVSRLPYILGIVILAGCSGPSADKANRSTSEMTWTPPPAGTIVAADSMEVAEDELNHAYFSVRLAVSEGNTGKPTDGFKYDVHATYGQAVADGMIIMPYGGANLRPLLRKGEGYSYIMGFIPGAAYGSDTAFHEYYRISVVNEYIRIVALKGFNINR